MRSFPKRLAIQVLFAIFLVLTFFEILLRIFWNPPYLEEKYKRNDLAWLQQNVKLNHFGYRDREFDLKKDPGTFRIYTAGSSYSFGWYLNDYKLSYPKQLELLLTDKFKDHKIEVVNSARPGFSLGERVNRLKTDGLLFDPDMFILSINPFDLSVKSFKPGITNLKFIRDLRLYQFLYARFEIARVAKLRDAEIVENASENSSQLQKVEKLILDAKKTADDNGIDFVLLLFPELDINNPNGTYKYTKVNEQFKTFAKENSINFIDAFEGYKGYPKKGDLIINPTDPHPSALANKLTANYLLNQIDFEKIINSSRTSPAVETATVSLNMPLDSFNFISSIEPSGWLYFNKEFGGTMNFFLPDSPDREVLYMEDVLKTSAGFTNDGWPGAKIEHRILAKSNPLVLPQKLYGYRVVGISGITGFWVEDGALRSKDLDLVSTEITRDQNNIYLKVNDPQKFLLYKITADIRIKQFDIEKGKITDLFSTRLESASVNQGGQKVSLQVEGKIGSLPKFTYLGKKVGYVWLDNKLVGADISVSGNQLDIVLKNKVIKDSTLEVPLAEELDKTVEMPTIYYK